MEYQHCPLMDQIDLPLNDSEWLLMRIDEIDALADNEERVEQIMALAAPIPAKAAFTTIWAISLRNG